MYILAVAHAISLNIKYVLLLLFLILLVLLMYVRSADEIHAMAPVIPEDSVLLTLPFAGAVLRNIGVPKPEIDAIMEEVRWQHFEEQSTAVELLAGSAAPDNPYFLPGIPAVGASSGSKVGSTGGGVTAGGGTSGAGSSGRGGGAAAGGGGGGVAVAGVDSGGDEAVFSSALLSQGGGSGSDAGVTVMNDVVRIRDAGLIAKAVKIALKERKQQEQQQQACSNSTNHTVVHDDVCDNDHAEVYPAAGA